MSGPVVADLPAAPDPGLLAARARLVDGLTRVRDELPGRADRMPVQDLPTQLPDLARSMVDDVWGEAVGVLRASIEERLSRHPDATVRAAVAGILGARVDRPAGAAPGVGASGGANGASSASLLLFGGGVLAAALGGPVGWGAAAAMMYGSWQAREQERGKLEGAMRAAAKERLVAWVDARGPELVRTLDDRAARALEAVEARRRALSPG